MDKNDTSDKDFEDRSGELTMSLRKKVTCWVVGEEIESDLGLFNGNSHKAWLAFANKSFRRNESSVCRLVDGLTFLSVGRSLSRSCSRFAGSLGKFIVLVLVSE